MGSNNILIGFNATSEFDSCVVIGVNLKATKSNQIIIGNSEVQASRELSDDEFESLKETLQQILSEKSI